MRTQPPCESPQGENDAAAGPSALGNDGEAISEPRRALQKVRSSSSAPGCRQCCEARGVAAAARRGMCSVVQHPSRVPTLFATAGCAMYKNAGPALTAGCVLQVEELLSAGDVEAAMKLTDRIDATVLQVRSAATTLPPPPFSHFHPVLFVTRWYGRTAAVQDSRLRFRLQRQQFIEQVRAANEPAERHFLPPRPRHDLKYAPLVATPEVITGLEHVEEKSK